MKNNSFDIDIFTKLATVLLSLTMLMVLLITTTVVMMLVDPGKLASWFASSSQKPTVAIVENKPSDVWIAPDANSIPVGSSGDLIRYGRELIAHTSEYFGSKGKVKPITNGMNCQNCHLDAGTKPFGNNYSAVASTYPKVRARSGKIESIEKRVNDCFERSLNGKPLDSTSHEMRAIVSYIQWLGKDVVKGKTPKGAGLVELSFLEREANAGNGMLVYEQKCAVCHGKEGNGMLHADGAYYTYPPLWGKNSYNVGAGLYRLSRFAGYIKANMPLGSTYDTPQLTDEEAWDVAAYVNSMNRPEKDLSKDWPDISKKPVDHPFGPYTDGFSEKQHKLGPFKPIQEKRGQSGKAKK